MQTGQINMQTSKEREDQFRKEFYDLLAKHGAEIEIGEDGQSYGMHRGVATITMPAILDCNTEYTHEFCEFNL